MEAGRLIAEAGWAMLDLPPQGDESEMMAQLLGAFPSYHGEKGHQELPWSDSDQASHPFYYNSNACSDSNASCPVASECVGYYWSDSNEALGFISSCIASDDLNLVQEQSAIESVNVTPPNHSLDLHGNSESSCEDLDSATNKRKHMAIESIDGKTRGRKCARKAEPKRAKKAKQSGHHDASVAISNGIAASSWTSDNDSNASQEPADAGMSPKGKAQAGRGEATDPQSLYARKRRERINERLKVLQSLVPNGTKVDISTMLEEAVHYVKFLQLQIKLLSSDNMWMYAPIAYNGMNIGIDFNIER